MTSYAVGAVNGNFAMLTRLLERIQFDRSRDRLWFAGNLVNGGADSLTLLRFVKALGRQAVVVLGVQELRLLAIAEGVLEPLPTDRFAELLAAEDCQMLLKWLCQRSFLHHEAGFTLVHAGIPAEWSLSQARTFAIEAESSLAMGSRKTFFENVAGATQSRWHAKLRGWKRLGFIVNAFTRMRYGDDNGRLDFTSKLLPADGYRSWYRLPERVMAGENIICAGGPEAGGEAVPGIFPLQRGAADNGVLSALRLDDGPELICVSAD